MSERQKPWAITKEELDLRFDYAEGKMSYAEYRRREKELHRKGLIRRSGKVIR